MSDLSELIERLEMATEPDRELDDAIAVACDAYEVTKWHAPPQVVNCTIKNIPPFTSSIDAALTLVAEGSDWVIRSLRGHVEARIGFSSLETIETGLHTAPAIALCIAALRAVASIKATTDE